MTEVEKMRNGLLADMSSPELQVRFEHAKKLLARMRGYEDQILPIARDKTRILKQHLMGL